MKFNEATKYLARESSVAGHSLGGGHAAAASEKTGLEAKTYNAAGVHPFTVIFGEGTDNIDNYYIRYDPLSNIQNGLFIFPDASGRQHELQPKNKDDSTLQKIKDGHLIETIHQSPDLKGEK